MTHQPTRPGQPPRVAGQTTSTLSVRLTTAERRALRRLAERRGVTVSDLLRSVLQKTS